MTFRTHFALLAVAALAFAAAATASRSAGGAANIAKYRAVPVFKAPGPAFDASKAKGKVIFNIPVASYLPFVVSIGKSMQTIGKMMGVKVVDYPNQGQPTQWVAGITAAIAQKADLIFLNTAPDPRVLAPQLAAARKAGIPVVVAHLYASGKRLPANVTALIPAPFRQVGQLLADGAVANGGKNILMVGENQFEGSRVMMASMQAELKAICPTCKVKTLIVPIADWATKIASGVTNAILTDKNINFVTPIYDAMDDAALQGLKGAGRTGIGLGSYNGTTAVLKRVQAGDVTFTIGEGADQTAYFFMDQALRILSGVAPVKDPVTPFRYFDASNAKQAGVPPVDNKGYGTDYKAGFMKLWGGM